LGYIASDITLSSPRPTDRWTRPPPLTIVCRPLPHFSFTPSSPPPSSPHIIPHSATCSSQGQLPFPFPSILTKSHQLQCQHCCNPVGCCRSPIVGCLDFLFGQQGFPNKPALVPAAWRS